MVHIKAFKALRPPAPMAPRVASPPYDVVSTDEAAALAADNPLSFLRVIRPEIDLPPGTDPHSNIAYQTARTSLSQLIAEGALSRDASPSIYLYRQAWNGRLQTGIVCCCHVSEYESNAIRKHEKTRQDKEDDRTRHVLALDANAGPVFLTFRNDENIAAQVHEDCAHRPVNHFVSADGVTHTVWKVTTPDNYTQLFQQIPAVYVADGHHRTASAARAAETLAAANPDHTGDEEYNWFLSVLFPASELTILPYNRVVSDLNGLSAEAFLDALRSQGELVQTDHPQPDRPGTFGVYVGGTWWSLAIDEGSIDWSDHIESLDVSMLQNRILAPILNIGDPRTDARIGFVGGIRGMEDLASRVDSGDAAAAFALHPTSIEQLLAVSDAGKCMPPKSTWFEPKLRSGLFVHTFDSTESATPATCSGQETS
ncbi:MAG: DUF1015 family protein [Phycisphaerales bacterium]|nr:DUF1015 family protein [Phycisphaerales bacterium]